MVFRTSQRHKRDKYFTPGVTISISHRQRTTTASSWCFFVAHSFVVVPYFLYLIRFYFVFLPLVRSHFVLFLPIALVLFTAHSFVVSCFLPLARCYLVLFCRLFWCIFMPLICSLLCRTFCLSFVFISCFCHSFVFVRSFTFCSFFADYSRTFCRSFVRCFVLFTACSLLLCSFFADCSGVFFPPIRSLLQLYSVFRTF